MSRENVELVRSLYPSPEVDLVGLFRDEAAWSAFAASLAPFVGVDFCTVMHQFGSERRYAGLEGLRAFMLDWTSPWASYRVETEKGIDLGDRVLLLNNDRG